ncbi:MAG TPA: type II/IV secretion system ATPase subunit, partial [Candidatus Thermoplasmatota archaeon]|nr:type II/IV secretion system ATPase subunit [Candidatus Thermoplasmatota archaeon]
VEAPAEPPAEAPAAEAPKKGLLARFGLGKKQEQAPAEGEGAPAGEATPEGAAPGAPPEDEGPVVKIEPPAEPHIREVEVYPVQEPYAFIRILYNEQEHAYFYEVLEPTLNERERNVLEFLEDTLIDVIEIGLSALKEDEAAQMLRKHVDAIIYDYSVVLTPLSKEKILYFILRDFLGYAKLDAVMRDDLIEDISCDGPFVPVFLYHRKYESVKSSVLYGSHEALDSFVIQIAQRSGKHISIAEPLLDATMPDGSRLNATLSDEVTSNGSTFTIRKFREDPFTPADLVRFGTMSADILAYWWLAVQNGASAIYAGGTASGKTTSLNAILLFIPPQMKIVSIEDTREINIPHENWIAGVTRSGFGPRDNNGRQAGEIDMFTLLKAALRQRPEYILVGEVRGQEAYALFQAMATGHTAYGTMHADSVESVIHRLESEPLSIPRSMLEALDVVSVQIQTRIGDKRVRRTKELVEIVGLDPHTREILTNEVFSWNPARDEFEFTNVSYVLERIQMERNLTEAQMKEEFARRKEIIEILVKHGIRDYKEVGLIIAHYYKEPEVTLEKLRKRAEEAQKAAERAAAEAAAAAAAAAEGAPPAEGAPEEGAEGPHDAGAPADPEAPAEDEAAAMERELAEARRAFEAEGEEEEARHGP